MSARAEAFARLLKPNWVQVIERAQIVRGWTKRDLTHEAGITYPTLRRVFEGQPTQHSLHAVCNALAIDITDLMKSPEELTSSSSISRSNP